MRYLLLKLLPKNLLSRLMGHLADLHLPSPVLQSVVQIYAGFYGIDLGEMKQPVSSMQSFNQFFTRELKEGARSIDPDPAAIVSPVDGCIAEFGAIENDLLLQTKGIYYSLVDLVGEADAPRFSRGYFITIYLSPADYHRIHSPIAGQVNSFSYFSGNLWPVNRLGVEKVGGLFALNERMVTPIESPQGTVALVKVGATVVGKIKTTYSHLESNQGLQSQVNLPVRPAKQYAKGEELGRFQLGSTVILLFEKGKFTPHQLAQGKKLQLGQRLGVWG